MNDELRDPGLQAEIDRWHAATPAAPPQLAARVRAAIAAETVRAAESQPRRGDGRWWIAIAATLILVVLIGYSLLPRGAVDTVAGRLVVADALAAAEAAEREHARAIARLQEAAAPILLRASHPDTPPAQSARLRALRERIASIDAAIAEIEGYLDTNPGLASARTMLLAAYMDKTELLREVLALNEEDNA